MEKRPCPTSLYLDVWFSILSFLSYLGHGGGKKLRVSLLLVIIKGPHVTTCAELFHPTEVSATCTSFVSVLQIQRTTGSLAIMAEISSTYLYDK